MSKKKTIEIYGFPATISYILVSLFLLTIAWCIFTFVTEPLNDALVSSCAEASTAARAVVLVAGGLSLILTMFCFGAAVVGFAYAISAEASIGLTAKISG